MSSKGNDVTPQNQSKIGAFFSFFYDSKDGTVLGRNAKSWGRISLFYVIYYGFLAGFFAMWLAIFVETLDFYEPRFHGEGSILGTTPGMNFRPHPDFDKNLIWFNSAKPFTYKPYVDSLDKFLQKFDPQKGSFTAYECKNNTKPAEGKACFFNAQEEFGDLTECILEKDYGYKIGNPCVVIYINKVYGWDPEPYKSPEEAPQILVKQKRYSPDHVGLVCEGLHATDTEHIGPVAYAPNLGFSLSYYPYMTVAEYLPPLVMVQFKNVQRGVLINVVCKMFAKNVKHNVEEQIGLTKFELMID